MDTALRAVFQRLARHVDDAVIEDHGGFWIVVSPRTPFPQFCGMWAGEPGSDDACAAALPGATERIEQAGLPFSLQTREGHVPATEARAIDLGLTQIEDIDGMILRPSAFTDAGPEAAEIAVAGEEDVGVALEVSSAGFGAPASVFEPIYTPGVLFADGISCYLARSESRVVSTGVAVEQDGMVGIFNVATPPEHRRRGFATALVAHAVRAAFDRGASLAFLQSSPMGSSVYRRLGFATVERYRLYTRPLVA